jgi:predicted ribosome quality control (RQC) complex YloA/Tae2 family protein
MPRRFRSPNGFEVLVGLDAVENERLSIGYARSHDLWFHARDCPGSHVVMRLDKGHAPPPRGDIEWAAGVAAWYSKQKGPGRIKVLLATGADISKPPKSAKGTVVCASTRFITVQCVTPVLT